MPELSYEKSKKLTDELNHAIRILAVAPTNIYEYIEYSKFLRDTDDKMNEYGTRYSEIKDLNQLMEQFSIKIGDAAQ